MIPVYQPDVQVWLHKTVQRTSTNGSDAVSERFSGTIDKQVIDLRPFLGEGAGVTTSKSVREPAGGFQLTLVDRPSESGGDFETLYGLIEPMDMVEIRARHGTPMNPELAPIIMRGFVTDVTRQEGIGGDGRPQRQVVVSGQDYGKIWQIIRISYHAAYLLGKTLISGLNLFELYGIEAKNTQMASEFVKEVVDKIISPYIDKFMPAESTMPRTIFVETSVTGGAVSPAIQTYQDTIYGLLRYFGDVGPWNELFIDDREDGVYAVYRPAPFLKAGTPTLEKIQGDAPDPEFVDVLDSDVMSISLTRSDQDIANFYWVESVRFNLAQGAWQRQEAAASGDPTVVLDKYPNSRADLYGIRLMTLETHQGPAGLETFDAGSKEENHVKAQTNSITWMAERRRIVSESNKDNVVFERGNLRIRGNEAVKAGRYIRLIRGKVASIYYVTQVNHEYQPFVGFFTTCQVERGTGFIERVKREGSPYLDELTNIR